MTRQEKIAITGWAAFAVMVIVCLFLNTCNKPSIKTVAKHDTISYTQYFYDTVEKKIPVRVSGPIKIVTLPIPANVDTNKILEQYYQINYYASAIGDSSLSANIIDTVSQNKITGRGFSYKLLKPTQITNTTIVNIDTTIVSPKRALYVGGFVDCKIKGVSVGAGPKVSFATKKQLLYSVGYDLINERVSVGAQIQLAWPK